MIKVRKGQAPPTLSRAAFGERFRADFPVPAFCPEQHALDRIESVARDGYDAYRKAPLTRNAGPEFADPDYDMSIERLHTRDRLPGADLAAPRPR